MQNGLFRFLLTFYWLSSYSSFASAQSPGPEDNPVWQQLRKTVFQGREIESKSKSVIRLIVAAKAEDAATVPIMIKTVAPQTAERHIKKIWLVIDNNPSPIGVVFNLTPDTGNADIETRVRVENSSFIRVVAQMNDDSLFMDWKPISASGGCSAPVAKGGDDDRIGKMKICLEGEPVVDRPTLASLMIHHPNYSGLSRSDTRVQYVKHVSVSYAGKEILSADVDFTISENPNFRFYFVPQEKGELNAKVVDTNDLTFETSLSVAPGT